ncbi:MAG: extracellular catalytic domain type 2 short-chain-length polyhydroxyalkanoate depolymerase [Burkholderiales bacterium]
MNRSVLRWLPSALLFGAYAPAFAIDPLPAYGANAGEVTVSGVSSGGFMAVQFHVAHSGRVKGAGVVAGGPYYCAQGNLWLAYYNCLTPSPSRPLPGVALLKAEADALARSGLIDRTDGLAAARVWLFSGTRDRTVDPAVVAAARRFYALHAPAAGNLVLVADRPAGHAMITEHAGNACDATAPPYINDCDYDAAGELLEHLLGALEPPAAKETGRIIRFDQRPFAGGDAYAISLADSGYAFVPWACDTERCRVHVAFHGCRQSVQAVGERFVREAGYNRWADANRLIVLYPQTIARNGPGFRGLRWSFVFNPRGCWDWWGYTDARYHTRAGPQIRAVKAMVDRLAAPRGR